MPPSFRRWFEKTIVARASDSNSAVDESIPPRQPPSQRFRPARYPRLAAVGCVVLIALCSYIVLANVLVPAPASTFTPNLDPVVLATSAFETAFAAQLGAVGTHTPAALPSPSPDVPTTTSVPPTVFPGNPWAASIPEAACIPSDIPQTGTVVGVVDGATIKVLLDHDGRVFSIRYIGIEAPAGGAARPGEQAAAARNLALTFRQHAILVRDITDSDVSGRLLRYVMVQNIFVNYALIAGGLVRADSRPPDIACDPAFALAEQQARLGDLGLWASGPGVIPLPTSP